jgi:hypothetical protein
MQIAVRLRQSDKHGRPTIPPTVSLLRYAYAQDSKRSRQVRVGTVPFWSSVLPDDIKTELTPDEIDDWNEFVRNRDEQASKALLRFHLKNVVRAIAYACNALDSGEKPEDGQLIWAALSTLSASLDKAGVSQEKRERGRPRKDSLISPHYLLLQTAEERDNWLLNAQHHAENQSNDECFIHDLPQFIGKRNTRTFPSYPDEDLVAHALNLTA